MNNLKKTRPQMQSYENGGTNLLEELRKKFKARKPIGSRRKKPISPDIKEKFKKSIKKTTTGIKRGITGLTRLLKRENRRIKPKRKAPIWRTSRKGSQRHERYDEGGLTYKMGKKLGKLDREAPELYYKSDGTVDHDRNLKNYPFHSQERKDYYDYFNLKHDNTTTMMKRTIKRKLYDSSYY